MELLIHSPILKNKTAICVAMRSSAYLDLKSVGVDQISQTFEFLRCPEKVLILENLYSIF